MLANRKRGQKPRATKGQLQKLRLQCTLGALGTGGSLVAVDDNDSGDESEAGPHQGDIVLPAEQMQADAVLKQEMEMDRVLWTKFLVKCGRI